MTIYIKKSHLIVYLLGGLCIMSDEWANLASNDTRALILANCPSVADCDTNIFS